MYRKSSIGDRRAAMRLGDVAAYCPETGDISWLDFLQSPANEHAGRRPALVLSPRPLDVVTARCMAWITRRYRDWSFHVPIPEGNEISGVIRTDQCAAPHGRNADRASFVRLQQGFLTKC